MFGIKKRSHNIQSHIYLLCMSEELGNMVPSFVYTLSTFCTPHAKSLQLCLTLCHPMNCSSPGSSVQGILWARILKRVAMPSFRGSFQPRDQTWVPYVQFFTTSATWEALGCWDGSRNEDGSYCVPLLKAAEIGRSWVERVTLREAESKKSCRNSSL